MDDAASSCAFKFQATIVGRVMATTLSIFNGFLFFINVAVAELTTLSGGCIRADSFKDALVVVLGIDLDRSSIWNIRRDPEFSYLVIKFLRPSFPFKLVEKLRKLKP